MLVESSRHTRIDLELWAEQEEADRVHFDQKVAPTLVSRAFVLDIAPFLRGGAAYCAVSWGKDSTALADLVLRCEPTIPLVWVRVEPIKNPDCERVRDRFLSIWPRATYDEIEIWCEQDEDGWHASGTLERGFAECVKRHGPRRFSGIRANESADRKRSAKVHGRATGKSARPLLHWGSNDVYAYLAGRELPVHPAYAMSGGGRYKRDHIRVASLGGRRGDGMGRAEWESEYYGDVLRRLASGAQKKKA